MNALQPPISMASKSISDTKESDSSTFFPSPLEMLSSSTSHAELYKALATSAPACKASWSSSSSSSCPRSGRPRSSSFRSRSSRVHSRSFFSYVSSFASSFSKSLIRGLSAPPCTTPHPPNGGGRQKICSANIFGGPVFKNPARPLHLSTIPYQFFLKYQLSNVF